jgi:hypothetical protein
MMGWMAPLAASECQTAGNRISSNGEPSMGKLRTIGLDNPVSQRLARIPWHRSDHRYGDRRDGYRAERLPQRARVCGLAWSSAAAEFDRGQGSPGRDIQARQPLFAAAADQRRQRRSAALEGDQCRSLGDRTAPAAAKLGRGRGAGEQDGAHRLGSGRRTTGAWPRRLRPLS